MVKPPSHSSIERNQNLKRRKYGDLQAELARAARMNVGTLSTEQVAQRITLAMDGYRTMAPQVTMTGLYRARKNISDKPWPSIQKLWYPPASKVLRGRFNDIGKPMFYACDRWPGTILEVRPQAGDLITFLALDTRERRPLNLDLAHIGLERLNDPETNKDQHRLLREDANFLALLKAQGITSKWLLIDNFLSDMATAPFDTNNEKEKYKITNAISNNLFKIPVVKGLIYPSVAARLSCRNLCLLPHIADQHFIPREAWMLRIEEKTVSPSGDYNYRFNFVRRSENIAADGQINWSGELQNVQPQDLPGVVVKSPLIRN